ncbi:MAG: S46 family peptidase [Bacteroidota bacterium]|nr:S46 family peptidase [Bacteroidota bacterium]
MMKKLITSAMLLIFTFSVGFAKFVPDEGMWLPIFVKNLNYADMQEKGLQLSADDIYSINHSSLKDAIVNFGNFCTAEVVSDQGLLLTNHHCGYGAINEHSTVENDYLTDGFWAYSKEEELKNDGLTATFFERMEDVTEKVLDGLTDETSFEERQKKIKEVKKELIEAAEEDGKYTAEVKSFFNGNEYYLFVYTVYTDVRLVGAPPSSIGKFGGNTDNWMWPRHTGDFSMFRVYTAPDGSPAEYAEENIPLKPKHSLPISLDDKKENDFAMIWGYPGGTDRYRTSYGINVTLNEINPAINISGRAILDAMKDGMNKSTEIRLMYASKHAQISNLWKNKKGEARGLKKLDVYSKKKVIENDLVEWINKDPKRVAMYGNVIPDFEEAYGEYTTTKLYSKLWYLQLTIFGSKFTQFTMQNQGILNTLKKDLDDDELAEEMKKYKAMADEHFAKYDAETEKNILAAALKSYYNNIPASSHPDFFKTIVKDYDNCIDSYVNTLFEESIFATQENFNEFLEKPKAKYVEKDMGFKIASSLQGNIMELRMAMKPLEIKLATSKRLFVRALREMNPDKVYYPNANFTMRLTYGTVLDYYPQDAVLYEYTTSLAGVMEKEDPFNEEFIVAPKLKELYNDKDYGQYANCEGGMTVCFLSNNDITGGNSGSPVINGKGELIGIAFDGNWEAMSGDIAFEPELQRTISVDIRYVMFVIDKYAGAQNLIDEMTFVKAPEKTETPALEAITE